MLSMKIEHLAASFTSIWLGSVEWEQCFLYWVSVYWLIYCLEWMIGWILIQSSPYLRDSVRHCCVLREKFVYPKGGSHFFYHMVSISLLHEFKGFMVLGKPIQRNWCQPVKGICNLLLFKLELNNNLQMQSKGHFKLAYGSATTPKKSIIIQSLQSSGCIPWVYVVLLLEGVTDIPFLASPVVC